MGFLSIVYLSVQASRLREEHSWLSVIVPACTESKHRKDLARYMPGYGYFFGA